MLSGVRFETTASAARDNGRRTSPFGQNWKRSADGKACSNRMRVRRDVEEGDRRTVGVQAFIDDSLLHISAVIGSRADAVNLTRRLGDDLALFLNLTRQVGWPTGLIRLGEEWTFAQNAEGWDGNRRFTLSDADLLDSQGVRPPPSWRWVERRGLSPTRSRVAGSKSESLACQRTLWDMLAKWRASRTGV